MNYNDLDRIDGSLDAIAGDSEASSTLPPLARIEPATVDNLVIRRALERIKERARPNNHTSYYTKHTSHSRYSKGIFG